MLLLRGTGSIAFCNVIVMIVQTFLKNYQFEVFGLEAQSRRPASRVFTTNIKSSSNSDFNCPEEFGYYPHPTDCSQYYVCVFGGALLESCTGGLMYSNELQTCDWPRNVGCELSDNIAPSAIDRQVTPRIPQVQTIQPQARTNQQQKFRFSSPSAPSSSGQGIPARVHAIPPPPQLKVAPNPVITSRGQPKFEEEKDLAEVRQLYAEAHETLPPVEEEESDRQQRVYRGQPSTVTQVQRDRDGLLHQPKCKCHTDSRVEQSTQSPTVYIQQPSSRPIPQNNNRNYYNTTNSNQGYSNPSQFDSYYSVYDEDVELYRDIGRSTLLEDDNNTTSETIILKLSTRAGIPAALVPSNPINIPSHSPLTQSNRNNQPSERNVQVLPNNPIPDSTKTKNPTRLIRTNDNVDARILTLSSGYQARSRSAESVTSTTTLSPKPSDIESQRQKILNFVVSDAQPQSFQPRPSTTSTTTTTTTSTTFRPLQYSEQLGEELDSQNAFVNRPSSIKSYPTTTTNAPNALISGIHLPANRLPKTENIKLVLTSGLRDVSNEEIKQPEVEQGSVEIVPLYIRESNGKPLVDATVEPTTYAPAKPFRSFKRPTVISDAIAEIDSQDGEESMTNIQQRPYEQNLESAEDVPTPSSPTKLVSKFSYKYLDDRNYRNKPLINEPAPYFTSRSNNFKEVLNKTYETSTTSKLFVSPYTSLRSILQDESVKSTSLRPVIRPSPINNKNQSLASSSPPPLRSYYSITGTPRSISTSSTTHRFIKSTTTESTTTTSTESTTTTTKSTIPTTTMAALPDQWIPLSSTEIDRYAKSPKKLIQHSSRNQYQSFSTTENSVENDEPTTYSPNQPEHARSRPTLKPSGTIVSKAQEFVDIYRNPPSRPEPLYPQPTPDKTAARCRKDVCLLPDCSCGGKEIPGNIPPKQTPQIVLITFDDAVNDLNKDYYEEIFERGRKNPNGCPITATFYVSHEWTDYGQVQSLYADGHEMASHTVSHSFGEQFSQKKWTREVAGQREILAAYGGVKLNDVRGMRAPFLSVGGNKMFKMLYDSNFYVRFVDARL
ncbi:hypothetical protein HA402_009622 [Bradysia odoriphaga]|nr:hypothetical protein HA402_009622 [Bradysia odoriphaga]